MVKNVILNFLTFFGLLILQPASATAAPYNAGKYNEDIPYGSATSLSISTDGDPSLNLTPTNSLVTETASSTVTVTSTDVVGYKLYIRADTTTDMSNGSETIPASSNGSAAPLSVNTWGYNLNGSSDFIGMLLVDSLVATRDGPYSAGDDTTFTYGVAIDNATAAGDYNTTVVYTAVPQTD